MKRSPVTHIVRGFGFAVLAIIALLGISLLYDALTSPSRTEELEEFLGSGEVIESVQGRTGLDSHYWARYRCDPKQVRKHIEIHDLPSFTSKERAPRQLRDKFIDPGFEWPKNIGVYTEDWVEFETDSGNFIIVAFPDSSIDEVFFLEWDI